MTTQILVVDDDIDLLGSLADFLGREGMAVSVLHEVRSLGEHIKRDPPDLIVLDPIMQGLNGLAALSTLRAAGNTVPVILTSGADDMDRIVGLEMGADDCIGKPFNPRELLARMRAVLRRQTQSAYSARSRSTFNCAHSTWRTAGSRYRRENSRCLRFSSITPCAR
jgi:two-component system phosphate regulon response regulator OmpR